MTILDNPPPGDTDESSIDEPVGKARRQGLLRPLVRCRRADPGHPRRRGDLPLPGRPADLHAATRASSTATTASCRTSGRWSSARSTSRSIALLLATPIAVAVALYVSHYAPRKLAQTLGYFIDLLAAIPSVVYGIWGIAVLAPIMARSVFPWLDDNLGFIPFFGSDVPIARSGRTMLTVGVVLAVMILPIITAISREVFLQTPRLHEEASLALGATRWEMIRQAVIPYGRSGVISGAMLGLGRALGETMAVAIILSPADGLLLERDHRLRTRTRSPPTSRCSSPSRRVSRSTG